MADKVALKQLVQSFEHEAVGSRRGGRGELGFERVAHHRRSFEDEAGEGREACEFLCQCFGNGWRHLLTGRRELRDGWRALSTQPRASCSR